jgi:predicted RecB family nuclease
MSTRDFTRCARRAYLSARATTPRAALHLDADAPPIFFGGVCSGCLWLEACRSAATARRDIALLPGLSRLTWEHFRTEGILTLDDLLTLEPAALQRFKGVGKVRAGDLHAHAQAVVHNRPVRRQPLPTDLRVPGMMFDLETCITGDVGVPWCFGWQVAGEPTQAAIVDRYYEGERLALPDGAIIRMIPDSDTGWRLMASEAERVDGKVFHWGGFERGVLKATAPEDAIAALHHRLHDLNQTFRKSAALPVRGTGIKKVAPYLGFAWPEGTDAFSAWYDYSAWLLESSADALARACAYNRADVDAMDVIWRWLLDTNE